MGEADAKVSKIIKNTIVWVLRCLIPAIVLPKFVMDNFGKDSLEYQFVSKLNDIYEVAGGSDRDSIESFAEEFRNFDSTSICRAYYQFKTV